MRKRNSEFGGGNDYYLIIILVVAVLVVGLILYVKEIAPNFFEDLFALDLEMDSPLVILVLGALGGLLTALWWSWNKLEKNAELHAQQDVAELLSLGKPMTNVEINNMLRPKRLGYRVWSETINDAIVKLADSGRIDLDRMKYSLAKKK
jgi:H+/Cl- antiporter ClcA